MKATSTFKLSKTTKRLLATMLKQDRSIYKSLAISAQLSEEDHAKRKVRTKEKDLDV